MISKKTTAAVLGAAAMLALLAGCTAGSTTADSTSKPTASATTPTNVKDTDDIVTGKCVDGIATIADRDLDDKGRFSMGDCKTVYINANGGTIALGKVDKVGFDGAANRVTYKGDKPEVVQLDTNEIKPAKADKK